MKKLFSSKYTENSVSFALFILRIGLGGLIIPFGYQKLVNFGAFSHNFSDPFHIGPVISLALTIFAEFFCGMFIVLGLMTRLACIPLIVAMSVVVIFVNHWKVLGDNAQLPALFLAGFIALLFAGPGKFSMDRIIGK